MTSTAAPTRIEPSVHAGAVPPLSQAAAAELRAAVETGPVSSSSAGAEGEHPSQGARSVIDQLSRIEDKTARIEEKYARSEALLTRVGEKVDNATSRMSEVALQSDLSAVRQEVSNMSQRVRGLPGLSALVFTAIVTALLSSAITVALIKYVPGILAR
jgi:hypothetical protein